MAAQPPHNYVMRKVFGRIAPRSARVVVRASMIVAFAVASSALILTPTVYASGGPSSSVSIGQPHPSTTQQNQTWLQAKLQYRVFSGVQAGQGKGAKTHPVIVSIPFLSTSKQRAAKLSPNSEFPPVSGAPSSYILATQGDQYVAEPGGGGYTNFPGTWNTQDDYTHNYSDIYYYSLCGPGAVDTALYYWPYPPNYANYTNVYDPMLSPSPYSSWKGQDIDGTERMRGYLLHLAYTIKAPTWSKSGMLPQTLYQTTHPGGATLQTVRDGLNWEASNENTSTWSSYFYVTQWNSAYYSTNRNVYPANLYDALHNDIVTDLAFSHVPMIVEVTAGYLPNWPSSNGVNHFIAIVGYNDTAGTYTYMDTCKEYTNCNPGGIDTPDAHTIDQLQLSEGVANIGTNTTQGDGGWVW